MGFSRETRAFKRLIWFAIGFAVLGAGAIAATIFNLRQDTLEQAAREQVDLAIVVSREIAAHNQGIEHVLDTMQAMVDGVAPTSPAEFRERLAEHSIYAALKGIATARPEIDVASLVADNGDIVNFTRGWPAQNINDSHKDDFVYLSGHTGGGTFIGSPQFSAVAGDWLIYFGRRLETAQGRFLGIVHVGVKVSFYRSIYAGVAALKDKTIVLRRRDGELLASYPEADVREPEAISYGSPWLRLSARGSGAFVGADLSGKPEQVVAVQEAPGAQIVVDIDESVSSVLARWRTRAAQFAIGGSLALVCAAALARAAYRQFRRVLLSESSLAERGLDLALVNARFAAVVENMPQGVALFDAGKRLTIANRRFWEMYGLSPADWRPGARLEEILRKRVANGFVVGDVERHFADRIRYTESHRPAQLLERYENGVVVSIIHRPLGDGGWLTIHEDVTDRQRAEDRIEHIASSDQLTGLANRTFLLSEMAARLRGQARAGREAGAAARRSRRFQGHKRHHGHPFGDALLKAVAGRLMEAAEDGEVVARIGGDEFALLQTRIERPEATVDLAERVLACVRRPFSIDDCQVVVRPSVGVASCPLDGRDVETLFKAADLALYSAKIRRPRPYRLFRAEPRPALAGIAGVEGRPRRRFGARSARSAFPADRRSAHPESARNGGARALAPSGPRHDAAGFLHPHRGGKRPHSRPRRIRADAGLRRRGALAGGHKCGGQSLAGATGARRFPAGLERVLANTGLSPARLTLEITETLLMENLDIGNAVLQKVRALGAHVALDDFGSGYSSLSYLQILRARRGQDRPRLRRGDGDQPAHARDRAADCRDRAKSRPAHGRRRRRDGEPARTRDRRRLRLRARLLFQPAAAGLRVSFLRPVRRARRLKWRAIGANPRRTRNAKAGAPR